MNIISLYSRLFRLSYYIGFSPYVCSGSTFKVQGYLFSMILTVKRWTIFISEYFNTIFFPDRLSSVLEDQLF
jgi:hypothetical protein